MPLVIGLAVLIVAAGFGYLVWWIRRTFAGLHATIDEVHGDLGDLEASVILLKQDVHDHLAWHAEQRQESAGTSR